MLLERTSLMLLLTYYAILINTHFMNPVFALHRGG